MTFALNANRKLIIHEGRLQMFTVEQHDIGDYRILQEVHRVQIGKSHSTRKAAQDELQRLSEQAIRAIPPQIESPELAGFLGAP